MALSQEKGRENQTLLLVCIWQATVSNFLKYLSKKEVKKGLSKVCCSLLHIPFVFLVSHLSIEGNAAVSCCLSVGKQLSKLGSLSALFMTISSNLWPCLFTLSSAYLSLSSDIALILLSIKTILGRLFRFVKKFF